VLSLHPEDLLLLLCVHGSRHYWSQLNWICDIAELLRARPGIDWGGLLARAGAAGGVRMLLLGLLLAAEVLEVPLPPEVARQARSDWVVRELAAQVRGWLFRELADEKDEGGPPSEVLFHSFLLRVRERARDRWCYSRHMVWSPKARRARWLLPLPAALTFLHLPLWPVRRAGQLWGGSRPRPVE
jgi:hypothetical protein